jgi:hypothetical protein
LGGKKEEEEKKNFVIFNTFLSALRLFARDNCKRVERILMKFDIWKNTSFDICIKMKYFLILDAREHNVSETGSVSVLR